MCILNPSSDTEHIESVLDRLSSDPVSTMPAEASPTAESVASHDIDLRLGWLGSHVVNERTLDEIPLLRTLDEELRVAVLESAYERVLQPGEIVVERWETSREFFVVLSGSVDVAIDGEVRARLGPGEFFGEIAALDWGAEYGYARLATVFAAEPTRLLVMPGSTLNRLVRASSVVSETTNAAIRARLPGL